MVLTSDKYKYISDKVSSFKNNYQFLKDKTDDYVFSALCLKNNYYKNPSLQFDDFIIEDSIVDGVNDGGVDIMFTDPNSESSDLIICQSKYYEFITSDNISQAIHKMLDFYDNMMLGNYQYVKETISNKFLTLNSEVGDESKIKFVIYTSASKNRIRLDKLTKIVFDHFNDDLKYELEILFDSDIIDEIKEAESRRPTVESGKLIIDEPNNILFYEDDSVIVNISAFSLKELYVLHSTNLLSRNLRYYIRKRDIDLAINNTIQEDPSGFWFKNNGITIICDDFDISGKVLKLKNFSVVNGGQTTTLISKSKISKEYDLFLPCKVIKSIGNNEDEKNKFSLEIAKATNSQKPIKQIDLKANAPEQVRFSSAMREAGIFYQTKRGEEVPKNYTENYLNTDLAEVGKLCLSAIFQLPAKSRNKPSTLYQDNYYNLVFNSNQTKISSIVSDLLYIDNYFRKKFVKQYASNTSNKNTIPFANNSRTICISFISFASRYIQGNITEKDIELIFEKYDDDKSYDKHFYDIFKKLDNFNHIFNKLYFKNSKDVIDEKLYQLCNTLIKEGYKIYNSSHSKDHSLNESNYLKQDKNYFNILETCWDDLLIVIKDNQDLFKL